jgi:hypothetical protein
MIRISMMAALVTLSPLAPCAAQDKPAAREGKSASRPRAASRRSSEIRSHFLAGDQNNDRKLSLEEFVADYQGVFRRMDADRDGRVSLDEYLDFFCLPATGAKRAPRCVRGQKRAFQGADSNGDQWLSVEESLAQARKSFAALDKDGDRFASLGEVLSEPPSAPVRGVILRFELPGAGAPKPP